MEKARRGTPAQKAEAGRLGALTCAEHGRTDKHIQIRNVSPTLHHNLKMRAASKGKTLSDYLREELSRLADQPMLSEWGEMVRKHQFAKMGEGSVVEAIRSGRKENDVKFVTLSNGGT